MHSGLESRRGRTRARWPDGFRCPDCGHPKGWELATKAFTWECAGCGKQTSVTAGTVMHGSKLPLTVWFWAAYLMATHSNGIAALQLQKQLGLGLVRSLGLAAVRQAAPRHGGARPRAAFRPGGDRRDDDPLPHSRPIRRKAGKDAAPTARCSSPWRWRCTTADPADSGWHVARVHRRHTTEFHHGGTPRRRPADPTETAALRPLSPAPTVSCQAAWMCCSRQRRAPLLPPRPAAPAASRLPPPVPPWTAPPQRAASAPGRSRESPCRRCPEPPRRRLAATER